MAKGDEREREGPREAFSGEHAAGLSESAQRAKWIRSVDEGPDRTGQTLATRNHEVIRMWAEARKAKPATNPTGDAERPRVLRFDFPGGGNLQAVTWDAWFRTFDERDLVFIYQETMAAGNRSNFFRLDNPRSDDG